MSGELARRLVPDDLWQLLEPLIPLPRTRPQGGGRSRADNRAVFSAIAFVLTSNCPWRALPPVFGVKPPTVHRRFGEWAALGLWQRLYEKSVACYGEGPEVDWTRALAESVESRTRVESDQRPVRHESVAAVEIDGTGQPGPAAVTLPDRRATI